MQTAEAISMMFMIIVRITAKARRAEQNTCSSTWCDTKHLLKTNPWLVFIFLTLQGAVLLLRDENITFR